MGPDLSAEAGEVASGLAGYGAITHHLPWSTDELRTIVREVLRRASTLGQMRSRWGAMTGPVGSAAHAVAYGQLRAAVLTRHFAMRRYWRADLLSLGARLVERDGTNWKGVDGSVLRRMPRAEQAIARWRVDPSEDRGENPLMFGGMLATFLAVEAAAGHRESLYALRGYLHTLDTLYPFRGDGFDGYPVRWDPYTGERWEEDSFGQPVRCTEFQPRGDVGYWPVPPRGAMSPRPMREGDSGARQLARWNLINTYRRVELSQDELCGLVAAYAVSHQLVDDRIVRKQVREQVSDLADYLASCGYHLVRPVGDFNARGAAGVLPAFEYPYSLAFARITGRPHAGLVELPGALRRAGVWEAMAGPYAWASVLGVVGTPILDLPLAHAARQLANVLLDADVINAFELARAWQIMEHGDVFDVSDVNGDPRSGIELNTAHRGEFALSFLLGKVPRKARYELALQVLSRTTAGYAPGFPPYLAITALGHAEPGVLGPYLAWLADRKKTEEGQVNKFAGTAFSAAVAVALGARSYEPLLVERIDSAYRALQLNYGTESWHDLWVDDGGWEWTFTPAYDNEHCALDYLSAVALAWWHEARLRARGDTVSTPGFPVAPLMSSLAPARVPPAVLPRMARGELGRWPLAALADADGTLFAARAPQKPRIRRIPASRDRRMAGWRAADPLKPILRQVTVTVAKDASVETESGVVLDTGDQVQFAVAGEIWSGVFATFGNGPNGWDRIEHSAAFPLHGEPDGHPFALIGRLAGYFFIGDGVAFGIREWLGPPMPLYLTINDDTQRGSGTFSCTIVVFR